MAAKRVSLKVSTPIEVGNVDVQFEVRDGSALMGTVTVSRGGVDWRASGKRSAVSMSWKQFGDLMTAEPAAPARSAAADSSRRSSGPSRSSTPARSAGAHTDATPAAIRQWARTEGLEVSARGALSQQVRDAFATAHS